MPNQLLASKTSTTSHACNSPLQKIQQCKQFVNSTPYAKDMNFQINSKFKIKMKIIKHKCYIWS